MTYTVKNGTWCKDNTGEYLSTTLTGLKAMRKAGQVPEGTRVVVHEPRQPAGTLIQSLNPNPPEGFMVPDGSAIDPVYEELIAVVGPNLPDLRECTLVMVGRSDRTEIANHDEYTVGQFKDDQFAEHKHEATANVTDNGHDHGRGTQNITGQIGAIGEGGTISGAFYVSGDAEEIRQDGDRDIQVTFDASRTWTGRSTKETTGITVDVSVDNTGTGNVTHGKQVGVYFYIAF